MLFPKPIVVPRNEKAWWPGRHGWRNIKQSLSALAVPWGKPNKSRNVGSRIRAITSVHSRLCARIRMRPPQSSSTSILTFPSSRVNRSRSCPCYRFQAAKRPDDSWAVSLTTHRLQVQTPKVLRLKTTKATEDYLWHEQNRSH